jgi:hypothetical protein
MTESDGCETFEKWKKKVFQSFLTEKWRKNEDDEDCNHINSISIKTVKTQLFYKILYI